MPDLPTGTVTLLFTDIEGSTIRWEHQSQAMHTALTRHGAILQSAIDSYSGTVFKTVGDAFYATFTSVPNALRAALTAQRELHAAAWHAAIGPLRVPMALHTGTPDVRGHGYFGPPLNYVVRPLNAGQGGQTFLSLAAQELVRDHLSAEVVLHNLEQHRLKDLICLEHIFQVVVPELPSGFPALCTLDACSHNLPVKRDRSLEGTGKWRYLKETRIAGAAVHTLRHTTATHHVAKGTDLKAVQETLGHASLATNSIYVSLPKKAQKKALQEHAL